MTPAAVVPPEERILDAEEDVLRRFGPAKATVVDVAKSLGVSHGGVYRHFPTKVALRDDSPRPRLCSERPGDGQTCLCTMVS